MLLHANSKVMTVTIPYKLLHVLIRYSNKIDISLARLLTWCACFVMVRNSCYHMPVGLYNIVIEHVAGTRRFRSTICSALDLVSFPWGRTSVLGLELGTQLWFVDWITGEIIPLSVSFQLFVHRLTDPQAKIFVDGAWQSLPIHIVLLVLRMFQ